MGVYTVDCRTCKGSKTLDYYEELISGEWRRRNKDNTPQEVLDALCKSDPTVIRINPGECDVCYGQGEYEIETTPCKIY